MSETEPAVLVTRVVTCHTEGCENDGVAISLAVPDDVAAYVCGPCHAPIDDVVEP